MKNTEQVWIAVYAAAVSANKPAAEYADNAVLEFTKRFKSDDSDDIPSMIEELASFGLSHRSIVERLNIAGVDVQYVIQVLRD